MRSECLQFFSMVANSKQQKCFFYWFLIVIDKNVPNSDFFSSQLLWHYLSSHQRAWPPSPSGASWLCLATGFWPPFSICWSAWWSGCSGWWKPSWPSGFLAWSWWIRAPLQTPRRFGCGDWCWGVSSWICSNQTLKRLAQWTTGWGTWRAAWKPWRRGKESSDKDKSDGNIGLRQYYFGGFCMHVKPLKEIKVCGILKWHYSCLLKEKNHTFPLYYL